MEIKKTAAKIDDLYNNKNRVKWISFRRSTREH
jgi:hypothetical protein